MTARILFSLSALAASLLAGTTSPAVQTTHESTQRLLRFVVPFVMAAAEHASPAVPYTSTPDAAFALAALSATPFRSSLWLVASHVAIDHFERRHLREFLRC